MISILQPFQTVQPLPAHLTMTSLPSVHMMCTMWLCLCPGIVSTSPAHPCHCIAAPCVDPYPMLAQGLREHSVGDVGHACASWLLGGSCPGHFPTRTHTAWVRFAHLHCLHGISCSRLCQVSMPSHLAVLRHHLLVPTAQGAGSPLVCVGL